MRNIDLSIALVCPSLILLIALASVSSEKFYIITSPDQPCPSKSIAEICLTLQQFASGEYNSSANISAPGRLILELLPGIHPLQTDISVTGIHTNEFVMNGSDATILCSSLSSMDFPNVQFVKISGINFTNCGLADFFYVGDLIIENCNFLNQQKSWRLERVLNTTIVWSSFMNGQVAPVLIVERSSLLIKQSMFVNTTTGSGSICEGAVINCEFSVLNIEQSQFLQNRADCGLLVGDGGAIYAFTTNVSITDSSFTNNTALSAGGAVYINGGSLRISNSFFKYNSADRSVGGALRYFAIPNSIFILYNSTFLNNKARYNLEDTGSGGAIYVEGRNANISLIDTTFNNNSAASCGALRITNSKHTIRIISSNFTHNGESRMTDEIATSNTYAQFGGGVACINGSKISVINSNFNENQAAGHAGVFHVESSTLLVQGSTFSGNSAQNNGGVIFTILSSTAVSVEYGSFMHNQAGDDGGVIYMNSVGKIGSSQVTTRGSSFGFNSATRRGGVIAITGGQVDFEQTEIYNNTARSGGVVSACISEVKVQTYLWISDDPANPQLCTFYDTEKKSTNSPVTSSSDKFISTLNAALGISIIVCVLVLLLYIIITLIILLLCGVLKCNRGLFATSEINNTQVYVPINA